MSSLVREMVAKGLKGMRCEAGPGVSVSSHRCARASDRTSPAVFRLGKARRGAGGRPSRDDLSRYVSDLCRADIADANHPRGSAAPARQSWTSGEELLTHNYVLVESIALLQSRLGLVRGESSSPGTRRGSWSSGWMTISTRPASASWNGRTAPGQSRRSHQLPRDETASGGDRVCLRPGLRIRRLPARRRVIARLVDSVPRRHPPVEFFDSRYFAH